MKHAISGAGYAYDIGLFAPFSVKQRRGNSIRVLLQASGLRRVGMAGFCLYSYEPTGTDQGYFEERVRRFIHPKIFPIGQRIARLPCRLVHVHHCIGAMLLKQPYILDMPSFMTLQTQSSYRLGGSRAKRFLVRRLIGPVMLAGIERRAILKARRVIVASDSIRRDVQSRIAEAGDQRFVTLTNPVDLSAYTPAEIRELIVGVSASDFKDRLDRSCLDVTCEVARRLPQVAFQIAGPMSAKQRAGFDGMPNVTLLGSVDHERYRRFLREISVFLNPYLAFWDFGGSKFKLLEAAAAGVPVISSTNGAIGFPDTEALMLADDVDAIVAQILWLADPDRRCNAGRRLRSIIAEKHDHLNEAKKLKELYQEAMSED